MTIHDSTTCRAGANGRKCDMCRFAEKAAQRAEHEEIGLPEAKNASDRPQTPNTAISVNGHLLYTEQNCSVFHDSDKQCPVCEGGLAVCRLCNEYEAGLDEPCRKAQLTKPITIPTFEQEWQDAPRWTREYVEQGRLRAVLFDVLDGGCTCAPKGHPWKFDDAHENFANEQRTRFVDEVVQRLQTTKTNIAQYWFIRGQFAKEVELLVGENGDLREIARVVRERLER